MKKNKSSFDNPVVLSPPPLNLNQVLLWAVLPFLWSMEEPIAEAEWGEGEETFHRPGVSETIGIPEVDK